MNWAKFWCLLLGHCDRYVYRNPCSQHPIPVSREHATRTVTVCGMKMLDHEIKVKCDRCERETWR